MTDRCRACGHASLNRFLDLGFAPPSNNYLNPEDLSRAEIYLPLRVAVCESCWLVQTEDFAAPEDLFREDYAYFSSTSSSWLAHAERYAQKMISELRLGSDSKVVELASNDGYLLQYFLREGVGCLGVEPTDATAAVAESRGIPVIRDFFGLSLATRILEDHGKADLVVGNNVYAHVPDINDFTAGIAEILSADGVVTLEFPHLQPLLEKGAFDTIYHEHFSYFSLAPVKQIFESHGLRVWRVEQLDSHGGSVRVYGCHADAERAQEESVQRMLASDSDAGLYTLAPYRALAGRAEKTKHDLLRFLLDCRVSGKKVAAYGAAAKGNTLLNYAGVKADLVHFVCDAATAKQGRYLPGSHVPIVSPGELRERKPDVVLLLPWNLSKELSPHLSPIREWGGEAFTAVPEVTRLELV